VTSISVRLVARGDGEDGVSMPGLRAEIWRDAEAAAYATDRERHLSPVTDAADMLRHHSPTPATPIDDVDGVGDRSQNLSMG
jgi:hypothetical protein